MQGRWQLAWQVPIAKQNPAHIKVLATSALQPKPDPCKHGRVQLGVQTIGRCAMPWPTCPARGRVALACAQQAFISPPLFLLRLSGGGYRTGAGLRARSGAAGMKRQGRQVRKPSGPQIRGLLPPRTQFAAPHSTYRCLNLQAACRAAALQIWLGVRGCAPKQRRASHDAEGGSGPPRLSAGRQGLPGSAAAQGVCCRARPGCQRRHRLCGAGHR
jgi:hypothetical protein